MSERGRRPGPRIRTIKPELWQEEAFAEISRDARLLYVGLTTQADDEGRMRGSPALLRSQIFPYDSTLPLEQLETWLDELEAQGLAARYQVEGHTYIALLRWHDEQRVDKPTPSRFPAPERIARDSSRGSHDKSRILALDRDHDQDQDHDQEEDLRSSPSKIAPGTDVVRLCELLADLIVERNPKARPREDSDAWLTAMRLLIADRRGDVDEVERVIRWSQADPFWQANILSPTELRDQFAQLAIKSANGAGRHTEVAA